MVATINADTTNGVVITSDTSGEIELQANGVTKAKITANGLQDANGNSITGSMYRNLIINGDMQVAQRGTSVAGITTNGFYTVDRFQALLTSMGTWTMSQDSDVPSGQGFSKSLKMACTTADASPAAADIIALRLNVIEGLNLQHLKFGTSNAENLTLSFWVKSNKTGTYCLQFYNGSVGYNLGKTITISSADTWEKKTVAIAGDTAHSFTNNNSAQLYLTFYLGVGSNRTSGTLPSTWTAYSTGDEAPSQTVNLADSTSNYLNITGVQLEVGSGASDFEFLPYDVQLARCQRYCYKIGGDSAYAPFAMGTSYNTTNGNALVNYPVAMRATPTMTPTYPIRSLNGGATRAVSAVSFGQGGATTAYIDYTTTTTSSGQAVMLTADGTAAANLLFTAEL